MAEVLGIAASGVGIASFSVQVVGHVSQLKKFIRSLKSAPQELNDLLDEIEMLNEILISINGHKGLNPVCTQWCLKAAGLMEDVLQECKKKMEKSKFRGPLQFVLKRDDIDRSFKKIERAENHLTLALAHLTLLTSQQQNINKTEVQQGELQRRRDPYAAAASRFQRFADPVLKISLPTWLSGRVFEICTMNAQKQWTISLKTYVTLPGNSLIFRYARAGDVDSLRDLLQETPSLIFSQDVHNRTPLYWAAGFGDFETISFILNEVGSVSSEYVSQALDMFVLSAVWGTNSDIEEVGRIGRLLIQKSSERFIGSSFDDERDQIACFLPLAECQQQILQMTHPPLPQQPEAFRFQICEEFISSYDDTIFDPNSLFAILGSFDVGQWKDRLPFILSQCMVMTAITNYESASRVHNTLTEAVAAGIDFTVQNEFWFSSGQMTPMLFFLSSYLRSQHRARALHRYLTRFTFVKIDPPPPLRAWAQQLFDAGVDLVAYGNREKSLHTQGLVSGYLGAEPIWFEDEFNSWIGVEREIEINLIGFTYGPRPEDWEAYFSNGRDEFAGDFWYMVEHPEENMPGAWGYDECPWAP